MIYETLSCLTDELNDYFRASLHLTENKVLLSGIMNQDGTLAVRGENKLILTLINIEKETMGLSSNASSFSRSGTHSAPLTINLYVLISAFFTGNNYADSLKFISFVMIFLQDKNVFTQSNTPRLHSSIDKLSFEIENLGPEKLNNMWATLGAKYMPSVLYKVRMITFNPDILREYRPPISQQAS